MKILYGIYLSFFIFSYTLAFSFDKRKVASLESCTEAFTKQCNIALDIDTSKDINKYCIYYLDDKCQNLMNNGVSSLPECADLSKKDLKEMNEIFKSIDHLYKFMCTKDEYGNSCPLMKNFFNYEKLLKNNNNNIDNNNNNTSNKNGIHVDEEEFIYGINQTCQSKICTDLLIETYNYLLIEVYSNNSDSSPSSSSKRDFSGNGDLSDKERAETILTYLKSKDCTSHQGQSQEQSQEQSQNQPINSTEKENQTNDAISLYSISKGIFIGILCIFLLIY